MNAKEILETAGRLVAGERDRLHGNMLNNFDCIAEIWSAIIKASGKGLDAPLDAHDVANMMEGLKIARRYSGEFNADDYVDGAGYAACAGFVRAEMAK